MIYSFYRKKGVMHISRSYIPMANWSQLDSPDNLMTMVMSSTKTYTVFPAIFMLVPAFMAQAAHSIHPFTSLTVVMGSISCLPVHPQQPVSVFPLPLSHASPLAEHAPDQLVPQSWTASSFWLLRALFRASCAESPGKHWGSRLNNSAFRSLALLRRLMSEDKPCSRVQRE